MKYLALALCVVLLGCSRASEPTVSVSATPAVVEPGQCANLTWSSTNASKVSIDPGIGPVDPNGSKEVCPGETTEYTVTAAGDAGSKTASATVTLKPLKAMIFSEAALFEVGKADLKPEGGEKIKVYRELAREELSSAEMVIITGYTDNVGDPAANVTLSQQRAEAVRDHLVSLGADASRFQVKGAGESNPVADNSTEEGRAQNRRVEVEVVGVQK